MRILYLADIRFPLERANGIQSMETCHALAARGHSVSMAVRPDTRSPARDPFEFYGLPRIDGLWIETAAVTGPDTAKRVGYLTFALGRALGRARQDLIFTRDLALASMLLRIPASLRAPVVYEAHGIAADTAAAMPALMTGAKTASPAKIARLKARDAHVWKAADGYVTITAGLETELARRFGPRPRIAVVPDGTRATEDEKRSAADYTDSTDKTAVVPDGTRGTEGENRSAADYADYADKTANEGRGSHTPPSALRSPSSSPFTIGYAGHLYPWKGVDFVIEAIAALPDARGLIVGGHDREPDLARLKALAESLFCSQRITFTGMLPPAEVPARLREAGVLVLPNPSSALANEFNSPLKLFEYMASDRPIVASDLPSFREVLTDGRNALLVEAGNPQAFTAAIRRIKEDPELGARLAAQALADVREYTWARRAEKLEALFEEVRGVRR